MSVENCHFKAKKSPSFHSKNVFIFDFLLFLFFSLVCECIMEWLRWASSSVLYVKTCCCINVAILKERKKRKQKNKPKEMKTLQGNWRWKWKQLSSVADGLAFISFSFELRFSTRGSNVKTIPAGGMFFSPLSFVGSLSPKATVKHPWRWAKWNSKFLRWKWEALPFC